MNLYKNNKYFEIRKKAQILNTHTYIVWVSPPTLYRSCVPKDLQSIIPTFGKKWKDEMPKLASAGNALCSFATLAC